MPACIKAFKNINEIRLGFVIKNAFLKIEGWERRAGCEKYFQNTSEFGPFVNQGEHLEVNDTYICMHNHDEKLILFLHKIVKTMTIVQRAMQF